MTDLKLCTGCKWHQPDMEFKDKETQDYYARCGNEAASYADPVTGRQEIIHCRAMRSPNYACQPAGNLWEAVE